MPRPLNLLRAVFAVAAVVTVAGCASTTFRSGKPPARIPSGYDERWHHGFLFGALEVGSDYDLAVLCPKGWAEVQVGRDPFTVLAGAATFFLYSPSRVTVVCAKTESDAQFTVW